MLKQITQPVCYPVTLEEVRNHLSVDNSDTSNDKLIELLIMSATADSQMKTGRVWVDTLWEWTIDDTSANVTVPFPIVPVTDVILYDLDEFNKEDDEPELPDENPEEPPIDDNEDGSDNEDIDGDNTEDNLGKINKISNNTQDDNIDDNDSGEPEQPDDPAQPEYTNIASEYLEVAYPSADPLGKPQIGQIKIIKALPANYRLILEVGYPVKELEQTVIPHDNPVLVPQKTGYAGDIIRLVFNRPVSGYVGINDFEVRVNGEILTLIEAYFKDNCVELKYSLDKEPEPEYPDPEMPEDGEDNEIDQSRKSRAVYGIEDGASITLSFFVGEIYDEYNNYVQPIVEQPLPAFVLGDEDDLQTPDPLPIEQVYESEAPAPIKAWILTRVGSLYMQRSEIALRAGKSNDAIFPDSFINNLLIPYMVRFLG